MSNGKCVGLDVGTNMLVAAFIDENEGTPIFKMERDAFYSIIPKSTVNRNSIRLSLEKRKANFIVDSNENFIVVGEDALEIATERNDTAQRPMKKGVLSPAEKNALPIIKLIIESLVGKGSNDDKIVFSVPASPVDSDFDAIFHTEAMKTYLKVMGYTSQPINEAFAIVLSELLDDSLTGCTISLGAGMVNVCIVHQGDPLIEFSLTRAGDYIDISAGRALDISPSIVQLEKEAGVDLLNPANKIEQAISIYYSTMIDYTLENIVYELERRKKELPMFRKPIPVVVSGGLTLATGFLEKFKSGLDNVTLPIDIGEVRKAKSPMTCVAHGALLAAQL